MKFAVLSIRPVHTCRANPIIVRLCQGYCSVSIQKMVIELVSDCRAKVAVLNCLSNSLNTLASMEMGTLSSMFRNIISSKPTPIWNLFVFRVAR